MKLLKNWKDFQEQIKSFMLEGEVITKKETDTLRDPKSLSLVKNEIKDWITRCYNYLSESFDDTQNEFAIDFRKKEKTQIYLYGVQNNVLQETKNEFNSIKAKIKSLNYYLKILSISDAIIRPNEINLSARKNYETEDAIELLLDKLYDLYDNSYYPVEVIFECNGIVLSRSGEERQIVNLLLNKGLVNSTKTRIVDAQLTLEGKLYVEEKRKKHKSSYNGIGDSKEEVSEVIDELMDKLNKLGMGQEILFDELQELKEMYGQLSKTNWGQLLKGKLIDLGLAQVIDKDTIKFVYECITRELFRLS
jgi:hypothetical protein